MQCDIYHSNNVCLGPLESSPHLRHPFLRTWTQQYINHRKHTLNNFVLHSRGGVNNYCQEHVNIRLNWYFNHNIHVDFPKIYNYIQYNRRLSSLTIVLHGTLSHGCEVWKLQDEEPSTPQRTVEWGMVLRLNHRVHLGNIFWECNIALGGVSVRGMFTS